MSRPKIKKRKSFTVKDPLGNTYTAEDVGKCPFCGGTVSVVDEKNGIAAVMHSMPFCEKFEAEEPEMFLRNMRMKVVGPMPDDDEFPLPVKQRPS